MPQILLSLLKMVSFSFFLMAVVYILHLLYPFICCWKRRLFSILVILNNAANAHGCADIFFRSCFIFFGHISISGLLNLQQFCLSNLRNFHTVSIVTVPTGISTSSTQGFPFSMFSSTLVLSCLFDDTRYNRCESDNCYQF